MIIGDCRAAVPCFIKVRNIMDICFIFVRNTRSERYEKAYVEAAQ
jgi:hypothetical protein